MTLEELNRLKQEMQQAIFTAIGKFEECSKLEVVRVELETLRTSYCGSRRRSKTVGVNVEVHL